MKLIYTTEDIFNEIIDEPLKDVKFDNIKDWFKGDDKHKVIVKYDDKEVEYDIDSDSLGGITQAIRDYIKGYDDNKNVATGEIFLTPEMHNDIKAGKIVSPYVFNKMELRGGKAYIYAGKSKYSPRLMSFKP